jgi:LysM repeat protein
MGENLFRISLRYNVSMDVIARANNIWNYNLVFAGQVLIIPQ